MKRKVPVHVLIEIENEIERSKETGILSYTSLSKLMHYNTVSCDVLARTIDLAMVMPRYEISDAIKQYDNSSPKIDELKFVQDIADKYNVNRGDVIERIQHVRRIEKEIARRA